MAIEPQKKEPEIEPPQPDVQPNRAPREIPQDKPAGQRYSREGNAAYAVRATTRGQLVVLVGKFVSDKERSILNGVPFGRGSARKIRIVEPRASFLSLGMVSLATLTG
jgi:hypothetical protein